MNLGEEAGELAAVAHLLRRTTFGPFPGQVPATLEQYGSATAAREGVLAAPPLPLDLPAAVDRPDLSDPAAGNEQLVDHWVRRMMSDEAGLHEKMTWFWHTHFPVSFTKSAGLYCWRQFRTFHQHALGNFGDLTKALCRDAALITYLDAAGSTQKDPNENLARELLELFTLGRGNYTEKDIRAAAHVLAGWSVVPDQVNAVFSQTEQLRDPVTVLGETATFSIDDLVDLILRQEAAAPFIAGKIARYLLGTDPNPDQVTAWASDFRTSGYEIRPLVEAILRSPDFAESSFARHRTGIEWLCTVVRATGMDVPQSLTYNEFAQAPYYPPNVAGWPDQWLTTSSLYARAAFIFATPFPAPTFSSDRPVDAVLAQCGLFEVSEATHAAVAAAVRDHPDDPSASLRVALLSAEFALS